MSSRVRVAAIAAAALLGAVITGILVLDRPSDGALETTSATDQSSLFEPVETPEPTRDPRLPSEPLSTFSADLEDNQPQRTIAPTSLSIAAVDLKLSIRALGVDKAGAMALPETVNELSWYKFGSGPQEPGATVIAGHVDTKSEGIGPLARLERLDKGDRISLRVGRASVDYRVEEVREVSKSLLDLDSLFARSGPPRLHLVTCAGAYDPDQGGYQANLVVIARPVVGP